MPSLESETLLSVCFGIIHKTIFPGPYNDSFKYFVNEISVNLNNHLRSIIHFFIEVMSNSKRCSLSESDLVKYFFKFSYNGKFLQINDLSNILEKEDMYIINERLCYQVNFSSRILHTITCKYLSETRITEIKQINDFRDASMLLHLSDNYAIRLFLKSVLSHHSVISQNTILELSASLWVGTYLFEIVHFLCELVTCDNTMFNKLRSLEALLNLLSNENLLIDNLLELIADTLKNQIFKDSNSTLDVHTSKVIFDASRCLAYIISCKRFHNLQYLASIILIDSGKELNNIHIKSSILFGLLSISYFSTPCFYLIIIFPYLNIIFDQLENEKMTFHYSYSLILQILFKVSANFIIYNMAALNLDKFSHFLNESYNYLYSMYGEQFLFYLISQQFTKNMVKIIDRNRRFNFLCKPFGVTFGSAKRTDDNTQMSILFSSNFKANYSYIQNKKSIVYNKRSNFSFPQTTRQYNIIELHYKNSRRKYSNLSHFRKINSLNNLFSCINIHLLSII